MDFILPFWLLGFPGDSVVKNLPANAGVTGYRSSIPGWGRYPRGGNGNTFQYSCLENSMDRGSWWATVHGVQRVRHALVTGHAVDVRLSNPDNGGSQYPKIKPFVSICISVFMSNHLYISISHIYTYIYIFISFLYIYLPHVHTYIYTHTHMYIYTHTYICKYMSCCAKSPEWITHCSIQGSPKK